MKPSELDQHVDNFTRRFWQDVLSEATAAYWRRRAMTFAMVGTPACDQIAMACYNASRLALGGDLA